MTTRITVALTLIGIGLAFAALAGAPFLFENRTFGDPVWWLGVVGTVTGIGVLLSGIAGQREANARVRLGRTIDIEQLQLERRSLSLRMARVQGRRRAIEDHRSRTGELTPDMMRSIVDLKVEGADLDTLLRRNANEFRRLGEEPSETPPATGPMP